VLRAGIQWQRMESTALRDAYHMDPQQKGLCVWHKHMTTDMLVKGLYFSVTQFPGHVIQLHHVFESWIRRT